MVKKSVIAIGLEPSLADYSAFPGLDAATVAASVKAQLERLREAGYEVDGCFIDLGETAETVVAQRLKSRAYECVLIGAGVRLPPNQLPLFEKIVNVVHAHAPQAKICFNTKPSDSIDAVRRWI